MLDDPQTVVEQSSSSIFTREDAVEQFEDTVLTPDEYQGQVQSKTAVRSVQLHISEILGDQAKYGGSSSSLPLSYPGCSTAESSVSVHVLRLILRLAERSKSRYSTTTHYCADVLRELSGAAFWDSDTLLSSV